MTEECASAGAHAMHGVRGDRDAMLAAPPPHARAAVQPLRRQGQRPGRLKSDIQYIQCKTARLAISGERPPCKVPSCGEALQRCAARGADTASTACASCSSPGVQQRSRTKAGSEAALETCPCKKAFHKGEAVVACH